MNGQGDEDFNHFSLTGGYNNGGGGYAQANFADASDSRPPAAGMELLGGSQNAIHGIVSQSFSRHLTELPAASQGASVQGSPALTGQTGNIQGWRNRIRDLMVHQNECLLHFLYKPSRDHPVIGPVEKALERFSIRHDVEPGALRPLSQLLQDPSGAILIQNEIESLIGAKGTSSLPQMRDQVKQLFQTYKETAEKLLECENQLKLRVTRMDEIQRRVTVVMEFKTNAVSGELTAALEKYLQEEFKNLSIESFYKSLLHLYQKQMALRDAIQFFKIGSASDVPLCPICLTDSVSCAIVPCGHTTCASCARRLLAECSICRGKIRERMKIYFT